MNNEWLKGVKPGDVITAEMLNRMTKAINANTRAVSGPKQKTNLDAAAQPGVGTSGGAAIGDEVFTAGPADITSTTVNITDDAGDIVPVERVDNIVFTETTSGRTMTLSITYV